MYRIYTQTALTATLAALAFAQAPQTETPVTTERTATQQATTASSDSKSYRGVVMDASCKAIQDRPASSISSNATSNSATTPTESTRSRAADSTAVGGAASASTSATTSATTGVATDQSGQATATKETTPPTEARSTASAAEATKTPTTTEANISDAAATGERNRSTHTSPDSKWMTVREKYKDCKVTPTTTSFAMMSDGQLYFLDDAGNALQKRMSSDTASDFHTMTVMGTMNGDHIAIISIE